jgi:hypothetical protein
MLPSRRRPTEPDIDRVGTVPGWFNHGQLWAPSLGGQLTPGSACHVVMWVRVGKDTFKEYALGRSVTSRQDRLNEHDR